MFCQQPHTCSPPLSMMINHVCNHNEFSMFTRFLPRRGLLLTRCPGGTVIVTLKFFGIARERGRVLDAMREQLQVSWHRRGLVMAT